MGIENGNSGMGIMEIMGMGIVGFPSNPNSPIPTFSHRTGTTRTISCEDPALEKFPPEFPGKRTVAPENPRECFPTFPRTMGGNSQELGENKAVDSGLPLEFFQLGIVGNWDFWDFFPFGIKMNS